MQLREEEFWSPTVSGCDTLRDFGCALSFFYRPSFCESLGSSVHASTATATEADPFKRLPDAGKPGGALAPRACARWVVEYGQDLGKPVRDGV